MQKQQIRILAVDDDELNLEILTKNLEDAGYKVIPSEGGREAWDFLSNNPDSVDVALLDKMMPQMDGMEILERMKAHDILREIPVIFQTGDVAVEAIREGLRAGAYYYLTKPFDPSTMTAVIDAVVRDVVEKNELFKQIKHDRALANLLIEGRFQYQTKDNAQKLAAALASKSANPKDTSIALVELMVNAIEHGNLEMGYENKKRLLATHQWQQEIHKRLMTPPYSDRYAEVIYKDNGKSTCIEIIDQGPGFKWQDYEELDPLRSTDPNGRGIAIARLMKAKIEYLGSGNHVRCTFDNRPQEEGEDV